KAASPVITRPSRTRPLSRARAALCSLVSAGTRAWARTQPVCWSRAESRWTAGESAVPLPREDLPSIATARTPPGSPAGSRRAGGRGGEGGGEGGGVEPGEGALEGAVGRRRAAIAEPVHQLDGLVAAPLGDGGIAAAAAEEGAAGLRQHGDQGMATAG